MKKEKGIGGLFFRAHDPVGLAGWYRDHLGITPVPSDYEQPGWRQEAGATAFVPFPEDTDYFGDTKRVWMVNFRVQDLDAMAANFGAQGLR